MIDLRRKRLYLFIRKKIRTPLFIFLFLLIAFRLNNYWSPPIRLDQFPSRPPEVVIREPEKEPEPPVVAPKKKLVKPVDKTGIAERKKITTLPLETEPVALLTTESSIDTTTVLAGMEELLAQLPPRYKMHKFYIPPVEYKLTPKNLAIPAGMLSVAIIATHTNDYRDLIPGIRKNFERPGETVFDDKAQLVPSASLFVLDIFAKEKHHVIDQLFLMAMSYGITVLPVRQIKEHYEAERPYGGNNAFPSGHTATAFVGAHMIYKEFKDSNPWIAYSGYAMGTVVGAARVIHNKHWVCDVLAGAAIAIIGTELAYLIYFPIRNFITDKVNNLFDKYILLTPVVNQENIGVNFTVRF